MYEYVGVSINEYGTVLTCWCIDMLFFPSGSPMALQQAHLQAAAARSSLQEALVRLHRLRQQLQDSSFVVENTSITVRETNQLVTHTHTAGWSILSVYRVKDHQQIYGVVTLSVPLILSLWGTSQAGRGGPSYRASNGTNKAAEHAGRNAEQEFVWHQRADWSGPKTGCFGTSTHRKTRSELHTHRNTHSELNTTSHTQKYTQWTKHYIMLTEKQSEQHITSNTHRSTHSELHTTSYTHNIEAHGDNNADNVHDDDYPDDDNVIRLKWRCRRTETVFAPTDRLLSRVTSTLWVSSWRRPVQTTCSFTWAATPRYYKQ